jgi:hypothetical protein
VQETEQPPQLLLSVMVSVQIPSQAWRSEGQTGPFVTVGEVFGISVTIAAPTGVSEGFSVRDCVGFSKMIDDVGCGEVAVFCRSVDISEGNILKVPDACRK